MFVSLLSKAITIVWYVQLLYKLKKKTKKQ